MTDGSREHSNPSSADVASGAGIPGETTAWMATPIEAAEFARLTGFAMFPAYVSWDGSKWLKRPRPGCMWKAESTSDPAEVRALWERHAPAGDPEMRSMIAVHCGKSRIFVVDVDYPDRLPAELAAALDEASKRTHVRLSITKATRHVYFAQPDGLPVIDSAFSGGEMKGDGWVAVSTTVENPVPPTRAPDAILEWTVRAPAEVTDAAGRHVRFRLSVEKLESWVRVSQRDVSVGDPDAFMRRPIERFWSHVRAGEHRRQAARRVSASMFIEAMAGCYLLEDAIGALLDAYKSSRESTPGKGWTRERLIDYMTMWTTLVNHFESGVPIRVGSGLLDLGEAIEEKMAETKGWTLSAVSWDPDVDPDDAELERLFASWREAVSPDGERDEAAAMQRAREMMTATSDDDDPAPELTVSAPGPVLTREPRAEVGTGPVSPEPERLPGGPEEADVVSSLVSESEQPATESGEEPMTAMDALREWASVEASTDPQGAALAGRFARFVGALPDEESRAEWVLKFIRSGSENRLSLVREIERQAAAREARQLMREIELAGGSASIDAESLELVWQELVPPDSLLRTDGVGLLQTGGISHVLFGDAGSGKTMLALKKAIEQTRLGRDVVWLDYEMGRKRLTNWLLRLGMDKYGASRLHVLDFVGQDGSLGDAFKAVERLQERLKGEGRSISWLVMDSLSRATSRLDQETFGGENDSSSFIQIVDSFVGRLSAEGVSTLMIDHVGHGDKTRQRGTSAKLQQTDVAYSFEVAVPWSRDAEGAVKLTCRKMRDGYFAVEEIVAVAVVQPQKTAGVDPEKRHVKITLLPPDEPAAAAWLAEGEERKDTDRAEKKAARQAAQVDELTTSVLRALSRSDDPLSQNALHKIVREEVPHRKSKLIEVLEELELKDVIWSRRKGAGYEYELAREGEIRPADSVDNSEIEGEDG